MPSIVYRWLRFGLVAGIAFGALALTACGGSEKPKPCEDVTCEFGTCDSENGQCVNESACQIDAQCIPGYECNDGTCAKLTECSTDADCSPGKCNADGACVNPDSCTKNSDCLERTYCEMGAGEESGTCEPDPCNDKACQRGVCKRGTDRCISAESCTKESEVVDCIAGQRCATPGEAAQGTCKNSENFCADYNCGDNGVCRFEAGGCTDAPNCSSDADCLNGKFCNQMGRCMPNLCSDVDCGDNGVCIQSTGKCENAEPCQTSADCQNAPDNHLCVEGTCRLEAAACGDASGDGGCPGNQTCVYNDGEQTVSCKEPETCQTSLDCKGERQCSGRSCVEPRQCVADDYESNDQQSEATSFHDVASNQRVSASVCSGDTDVYTLETGQLIDPSKRGTLIVELDVPARQQGLGGLELVLQSPNGSQLDSATTGAHGVKGHVEVEADISISDHGTYLLKVTGAGDVKTAGVGYDLSANILPDASLSACREARVVQVNNSRISGTTDGVTARGLSSSCTADPNPSPEQVYALNLSAPQEVSIKLSPQGEDVDLSMSLRSSCAQPASERACVNEVGAGKREQLTALLEAGTHYLVVQSPTGEDVTGGAFELRINRVFAACSPKGNYCSKDGQTANICAPDGGAFNEVDCKAGCAPTTGRCFPPVGNSCARPVAISPDKVGENNNTRQIQLNQLTNEYQAEDGSCLGEDAPDTGGPDQAFKVTVPAKRALTAEVTYQDEVEGSMYLVKDCSDVFGTCQTGVEGSLESDYKEKLTYANHNQRSDSADNSETFYLIVDTESGQSVSTAQVKFTYEKVICSPGFDKCTPDETKVKVCAEYGRKFNTTDSCANWGCSGATCLRPDTCEEAINATAAAKNPGGVSYTGQWANFTNDYEFDTCDQISEYDTEGAESTYRVDLAAGEAVRATLSGPDNGSLYIKSSGNCGSSGSQTCLDFQEDEPTNVVSYAAGDTAETVYVVADRQDGDTKQFTVGISVTDTCTPSGYTETCSGSGVTYCTGSGSTNLEQTRTCPGSGGCTNGRCDTKNSDFCWDAEDLTSKASRSSGVTRTINWGSGDYTNDYKRDDLCDLSDYEIEGPDAVYVFDLAKGDVLSATLDQGSSSDDGALSIVSEVNCANPPETCLADDDGNTSSVTHAAGSAGHYYLIADVDEPGSTASFTLDARVYPGCDPTSYTTTCSNGNVDYCGNVGPNNAQRTYACSDGCSNGKCNTSSADICYDAENLTTAASATDGTTVDINWKNFTNQYERDDACGISDYEMDGPDAVYQIDLGAGEGIRASLVTDDGSYDDPALSLVTEQTCGAPQDTCLDAQEDYDKASIEYATDDSQTVYLIADTDDDDTTAGATLTAEIFNAGCIPSAYADNCSGVQNLNACTEEYTEVTRTCGFGCSAPTGGEQDATCDPDQPCPNVDNITSLASASGGVTFNMSWWGAPTIDQNGEGCTSTTGDTDGPEVVWAVDLAAGETLDAEVLNNDPGYTDETIAISSTCQLRETTCLDEQVTSDGNAGSASYTAGGSAETVYLIVESDTDQSSGDEPVFDVHAEVTGP